MMFSVSMTQEDIAIVGRNKCCTAHDWVDGIIFNKLVGVNYREQLLVRQLAGIPNRSIFKSRGAYCEALL